MRIPKNLQKKIKGFMQWDMNNNCNYNCSYCNANRISSKKNDPLTTWIKLSKILPENWLIYICGSGEPFCVPDFFTVLQKLIKAGHLIGIRTNFSSPTKELKKFINIVGDGLFNFGVSLHLEYWKPDDFLKKALVINKEIGNRFYVVSVVRPGRVEQLIEIGQKYLDSGLRFSLQLERDYKHNDPRNPYVKYTEQEKNIINKFMKGVIGRGFFQNSHVHEFKSYNRLCEAGRRYLVLGNAGDIWRCNTSRRHSDFKNGYLGNLLKGDDIKLGDTKFRCIYKYCHCPPPLGCEK